MNRSEAYVYELATMCVSKFKKKLRCILHLHIAMMCDFQFTVCILHTSSRMGN